MRYKVLLLRRAKQDLNVAADWIAQRSPRAASQWFNGLVAAIQTLEINPERCGFAPENEDVEYELRQLICRRGKGRTFRVIFTITGQEVRVLRIRGAGQDTVLPEDL